MSRIGKRKLLIPENVNISIKDLNVKVEGPLGSLEQNFSPLILVKIENEFLYTIRNNEEKKVKQLHGTTNSLIQAMIEGVTKGFKKEIVIQGVGYKAILKNDILEILAGYSHPVFLEIIKSVKIEVPKPTSIILSGISKQKVTQMAANIRSVRKPSVYSKKGIIYKGEIIKRKEGKTSTK